MSEQEIKKAGDFEDGLGLAKAEISEVTITEYRKSQIVRMGECVIGMGLIGVGVGMRKKLPTWLSVSLGVVGAGMTIYNGRNLYLNFKQDGKLIREAIKMKKVEEKKVRDERKKKPEAPPASQEKKSEQPSSQNGKSNQKVSQEKIKTPASNGSNNNGSPIVATSANGKSKNAIEVKANNEVEAVIEKQNESSSHEVNIIESEKKEGEEIIANISAEEKSESPSVEATIISTEEKIPLEENGNREALR